MPETRKKWNFRRWRRQWKDRLAALSLRWRIWFDQHILSHEKRRQWRRRWTRRSERLGRVVEQAGYKVLPHRPDTEPNTGGARLIKWFDDFVDRHIYPPEIRSRHKRAFRRGWREFTAPFRHANNAVRRWLDNFLLPRLTPPGFRKAFFNWRGAAAALGLIGLIGWVGFWLIPQWRAHNETKWSAQARLLLNRGYQVMAYQDVIRVLQQNEKNEAACRLFADLLEQQGLPEALHWRRKVIEQANTTTNQLALAATALIFEPPPCPTAARILADLKGVSTNSSQFHVVAAQLESRIGNLAASEKQYLAALQREPANSEIELALALLRLQMRDTTKAALAEAALNSLSERTNMTIRALRPLVALAARRGDFGTAIDCSKRILANESSTFEDRLAHLDVLTRKRDPDGDRFRAMLQEQIGANPLYASQLGGWMISHQQARAALSWFRQLPPAIQRSDLIRLATSDAYAAEADWQGLEQFLLRDRIKATDQPDWGTIEFVRQAMLARAYRGMGDRRAFADTFKGAKDLASGMAARLTRLAAMVENWGWDDEVEELLWAVFERFPREAWAADGLLKIYHDQKNTDGIRRVFALQLKRSPKDALLKNNLAMMLLLRGEELPSAHRLALESHRQNPQSAVNTSTYAFSLFVQGHPAEARKIMETLDPEILKVPSIAAYYALFAEATGDQKAARQYLSLARQADLLPEEKNLLAAAKRRL